MSNDLDQYVERRYVDEATGAPVTVFKPGVAPMRAAVPFGGKLFLSGLTPKHKTLSEMDSEDERFGGLDCARE